MRRSSFRLLVAAASITSLAACGGQQQRSSEELQTYDVRESPPSAPDASAPASQRAGAGPDIRVTAAPGVAFNYRHSFAMEPDRIAEVQERHAQACEELGVSRCRITGMNYRRLNEHDIEGMLQFKLEPALARRFGQVALQSVQEAGGMLVESEISGTDVGSGIQADTRSIQQLNQDLQRIERQLADPSVSSGEKETLRIQADQIRQQIRNMEQSRQAQQETLATTPVTFHYGTDDYGTNRPSFSRTLRQAGDGFVWGLYGLLVVAVTLAPWLALAGLIWFVARRLRRRLRRRDIRVEEPAAG
jgi:hypothetical protein